MSGNSSDIFSKVLFIGPSIKSGGGIASVLASYRDHVDEFNYLPTNSPRGTLAGLLVLFSAMLRLPWYRWRHKLKVLHVHSASGKSFTRKRLVMAWGKMLGYDLIFHCHGGNMRATVEKLGKSKYRRILSRCSQIAVISSYWKKYFTTELEFDNVRIINNIVERAGCQPAEEKRDDKLVALFLGKVCREKGIFDLLDVIAENQSLFRGKLNLRIGGNDKASILQKMVAKSGIDDIVTYLGWVSGERKDQELNCCDMVILPSYIEGVPICLLEAMDRGKGIITTNVGGIPDIVDNNANGFMFDPGDKAAMLKAIEAYIDDRDLISRHAEVSVRKVQAHYPDQVIKELESMYESVIKA